MRSAISNPMPGNTSVSFGKTDSGLPFFETREEHQPPFTVEDCDRFIIEMGGRPATPEEVRIAKEAQIRAGLDVW
jgi:hypothetical protein